MMDPIIPVHCRTCMFWRQGFGPIATEARVDGANPDLGVCEFRPPTIHIINGYAQSMYPAVHAERACWEWEPEGKYLPDGPGGGERAPSNVIPMRDAA